VTLSPAAFRERFLLDPSVVFLNHGSFGAVPRVVFEHQEALRRRMEAEPVRFLVRSLPGELAAARTELAAFVGAEPAALALTTNTTTALHAVARSVDLRPGDEVLLTDHEYGAMRMLWDEVARRAGATVAVAELPCSPQRDEDLADAVLGRITARTRVVFFSHVTSVSAMVLPAARICAAARRAGVLSVVDGAHGPGLLDLDLAAVDAGVYVGNAHKWLLAPRGAAFIAADADARRWIAGPVVSWGWTWDGEQAFLGRFDWPGTHDPTAPLCIPRALAFRREHDWPAVAARCRALASATLERLVADVGAVPTAGPDLRPPQMVAARLPAGAARGLHDRLWREHRIEIPVEPLHGEAVIRLSVQAYTSEADCDRLVSALARPGGRATRR
jgi:isopenicillin-N epimerase